MHHSSCQASKRVPVPAVCTRNSARVPFPELAMCALILRNRHPLHIVRSASAIHRGAVGSRPSEHKPLGTYLCAYLVHRAYMHYI